VSSVLSFGCSLLFLSPFGFLLGALKAGSIFTVRLLWWCWPSLRVLLVLFVLIWQLIRDVGSASVSSNEYVVWRTSNFTCSNQQLLFSDCLSMLLWAE
jgi:hypothetical protein